MLRIVRTGETMSATGDSIDAKRYSQLLAEARPARIRSEKENERMLAEIERLMDKREGNLSPEEEALFDLVGFLVEDFESRTYPIPDAPPFEILQFLMEQRGLKQADLVPILGTRGHVSDIVNGKHGISKLHAKQMGEFFHVSAEVFL
jgi:HTH-type transcriptional regulator/antitoxin HigA